ncbi:hypothetical protein [Pararhizobium sp. PWRC1-1]|uniref:hypothetical protein n=1 Tax=Pararhizobium sp. PWRC1-1 TaxID=2804566 RepID=UPI003CFA82B4
MIVALVLAGLVSFAAALILRIGAFYIFAVLVSLIYLMLTYQSGSPFASLAPVLELFLVMQFAYVAGVLLPCPKLQQCIDSCRKKGG